MHCDAHHDCNMQQCKSVKCILVETMMSTLQLCFSSAVRSVQSSSGPHWLWHFVNCCSGQAGADEGWDLSVREGSALGDRDTLSFTATGFPFCPCVLSKHTPLQSDTQGDGDRTPLQLSHICSILTLHPFPFCGSCGFYSLQETLGRTTGGRRSLVLSMLFVMLNSRVV